MNQHLDHDWELVRDRVRGESLLDGEDLTEQELRERWESELSGDADEDDSGYRRDDWDERDCGGVYDGVGHVYSDADPGL